MVTFTPDQLNIKLGQLQAQRLFLQSIGSYKGGGCSIEAEVSKSNASYSKTLDSLEQNSTNLMTRRCKCFVAGGDTKDQDCAGFQGALDLSLENAQQVAFQFQGNAALEAMKSGNEEAVNTMIEGLDRQIGELKKQLQSSGSVLSEVGEAADGITGGKAPTGPWLYFNWTSEESKQKEESSQSSISSQTSASYNAGLFSIGGSFGFSRSTANSFSSLKRNRVQVAGQIMRVSVQMPWFRPELFRNEQLKLVSFSNS